MSIPIVFGSVAVFTFDVQSAIILTQPGAEFKNSGDSVRLSCKTSGYTYTSDYLHWIRQSPENGLEWIVKINTGSGNGDFHPSFQGRFTISQDVSATTAFLQIHHLRLEDTAMYYCATDQIWGSTVKQLKKQLCLTS
uniref:Ig-like domain-containing protein n=1 Tax=Latimeria chalumnae TaxID=7897 RepID=H2ZRT4_LATCH